MVTSTDQRSSTGQTGYLPFLEINGSLRMFSDQKSSTSTLHVFLVHCLPFHPILSWPLIGSLSSFSSVTVTRALVPSTLTRRGPSRLVVDLELESGGSGRKKVLDLFYILQSGLCLFRTIDRVVTNIVPFWPSLDLPVFFLIRIPWTLYKLPDHTS